MLEHLPLIGVLVSSLFLALPAAITSTKPGNVFVAGERVVLKVTGAAPGAPYRVTPYDGPVARQGVVAGEALDLGALPRGYYTVSVGEGPQAAQAPVVVVPRPRPRRVDRLAVDAAHSWLIPPARFADGAELLRLAGFHWIRERLNWGEVEPERGKFVWGRYDASAEAEAARGLRVYQIFHACPSWARADGNGTRFPDDLRDVYTFARQAAIHFKGKVGAWEVWNEADIAGFSTDSPAEYAAFFKAAVLGFKAGDRNLEITQVSLALQATRYHEGLYRNGTADYMDIFNYHIYDLPANYPRRAQGHFDVMDAARVWNAPVWLTEAGIPLHETGGTLSEADRRKQAEFIPKSYAMSLASGTDRHHFFVFPHYLENGIEFGVMDADMHPYPGYAALAAVTSLLGEAEYRGRVPVPGAADAQALRFANGTDETIVAWSDAGRVPAGPLLTAAGRRVYNCVGAQIELWDGVLGPSPVFLVGKPLDLPATPPLARRDPSKIGIRGTPSDVVLRVRLPEARVIKTAENHLVRGGAAEPVEVQVYNFGKTARRVHTLLRAPSGWKLDEAEWSDEIAPLGRTVHQTRLHVPSSARQYGHVLRAEGKLEPSGAAAPVELDMAIDPDTLRAAATLDLHLNDPARWANNISTNGEMHIEADPDGGVRFRCTFRSSGDRWAYPTVSFDPPADWSAFDAVEAEVAADRDDADSELRFQVAEPGGSAYYTETSIPAHAGWKRVVTPFSSLSYGAFSPPDPDGRLDTSHIAQLRFGVNTRSAETTIRIRNVKLVRWG